MIAGLRSGGREVWPSAATGSRLESGLRRSFRGTDRPPGRSFPWKSTGEGPLDRVEELSRLVAAVRNGHPERMDELLGASAGIVHAVARARLGDSLAAEEAAADALVRVVRGLSQLEEPRAYVRWLGRIAARCAADAGRRRADAVTAAPEEPADPAVGPAAAARRAERAAMIRHAVAGLPRRLRAPVLLHYVEGLGYRDVAAVLGTSLSTVSRRIGRALAILRKRLGEEP